MSNDSIRESLVLVPSNAIQRFEGQLLPALQARGVFTKDGGGNIKAWIINWLRSDTGFFWGATTNHPEVGGVYLVHPKKQEEDGSGFVATLWVGDSRATLHADQRLPDSFHVRVRTVDKGRAEVELCDAPKKESAYSSRFRVFHTADGVTGQLEAIANTETLQLVNILPNERMSMEDLLQLPERISVRKNAFPLEPVRWVTGHDEDAYGYRLACECHNCHGDKVVECEKCGGTGSLTCNRCNGSGHVGCKRCGGSGTVTLPAKDAQCKKCGGSGDYYKNGNYIGDCSLCDGTGVVHLDERDVDCSACNGTGQLECNGCSGSGSITCFSCKGEGRFDCWVCGGSGSLGVSLDSDTGGFYRKYKGETTWLDSKDVYLLRGSDESRIPLAGRWTDLLRAIKRQKQEEELARARYARIAQDGQSIDSCLERVLRISPASVKAFEVRDPVAATGRKQKGRVRYTFRVVGNPPWLAASKKGESAANGPEDRNQAVGPFSSGTSVVMEDVAVPEGKDIHYEECDSDGRNLTFSFPMEVDFSSLEGRRIEVKADEIPPPEKRERERLGFWLKDTRAPIFRSLVEGVEEDCADIGAFFNGGISKFPTQADAIRRGLSKAPLLLLKGPPGTGKTTVIVEMIRQAVRQGKRVLLTSQTHQAVDNVLERLHAFRQSGEDRNIRMAVYAANEGKLSDLGHRYLSGSQEEELQVIRSRSEDRLARLEADCQRNRIICTLLSEGAQTAETFWSRLGRRDAELRQEEQVRDQDFERMSQRCTEEMNQENTSFSAFQTENGERQQAIQGNIDSCVGRIRKLEKDRDWFEGQAKGRFEKSSFATNTRLGRFLRSNTDSLLRGIDSLTGTHLDPEHARAAWVEANQALNAAWEEKRGHENDLAGEKKKLGKRSDEHGESLHAIESRKEAEQTARKVAAEERFASIRAAADVDTAPMLKMQGERIAKLKEVDWEKDGIAPDSSPESWRADIEPLNQEFSLLDKKREFALDWAGELNHSPTIMVRFLNAQTNVFFATCVGMGSWRALADGTYEMRDNSAGGAGRTIFDLAIVDEAGHATFAETVVPLCSARKAILIGDDKQLPPMLGEELDCRRNMDELCSSCATGDDGRQCWFEYSMFQYLWENKDTFSIPRLMLDTQFRMHPDIADFISQAFYDGQLKNGVAAEDRHFAFGSFQNPVCLLSTSSQKNRFEEWKGTSCSNPLEVEYVQGILEELVSSLNEGATDGDLDRPLSLAVITPYAAQEALLKGKLGQFYRNTDRMTFSANDIASVDRFQGDERDIVIASFVRSPNMKSGKRFPRLTFVHDMKRMNVALSRARRMLILVCDIKALESAPGNEGGRRAFSQFHSHVAAHGREILVWERKERHA